MLIWSVVPVVVANVRKLRRIRGVAMVALFDPSQEARDSAHALHVGAAPIEDGQATIVFRDVAPGRYAAALLRAEDPGVEEAIAPTHADVVFEVPGDERPEHHVELVPHELLRRSSAETRR